jgi:hypothetical protein
MRFLPETEALLKHAGWASCKPSQIKIRSVDHFQLFEEAEKILIEFGGLSVGSMKRGRQRATSVVEFIPEYAEHLSPALRDFQRLHEVVLYPLAALDYGHAFLFLDNKGRCYSFDNTGKKGMQPLAPSFTKALDILLLGLNPESW